MEAGAETVREAVEPSSSGALAIGFVVRDRFTSDGIFQRIVAAAGEQTTNDPWSTIPISPRIQQIHVLELSYVPSNVYSPRINSSTPFVSVASPNTVA